MDRRAPSTPAVWLGLAGGCFVLTVVVYFRYGFVAGFLPLLGGVYASRRWLLGRTVAASREHGEDETGLVARYEVDTDREYTTGEQATMLREVRAEYRGKHHLWAGLAAGCLVVAAVAALVSVVLAGCTVVVAGYCGLRWYRVRRALGVLDGRLETLEGGSSAPESSEPDL